MNIEERCMAVVGTVWTGPMYCGKPQKGTDINGRPICGLHRRGQPGVAWHADKRSYPEGTRGEWEFKS